MLSKSQVTFIKSLHQKKFRRQHGLFIVEGTKSIFDFISSGFKFHSIYYTAVVSENIKKLPANIKLFEVNNAEIEKISTLQTPQGILGVVELPEHTEPAPAVYRSNYTLVLDGVQDPGNLGTIIRTADWFGMRYIVCSNDTVEAFSPKVVQATMGSLSRIKVYYTNLEEFFNKQNLPVFGAYLEGDPIYGMNWGGEGFILLGNEGQGISAALKNKVTQKVNIPRFGEAESLNVAISAAIFCSEIKRGA